MNRISIQNLIDPIITNPIPVTFSSAASNALPICSNTSNTTAAETASESSLEQRVSMLMKSKVAYPLQTPGEEGEEEVAKVTVSCWHSTVAQKSYGTEKRYLSPPPKVQVLTDGELLVKPVVSMSVVYDKPVARYTEYRGILEDNACQFKTMHVAPTATTAKTFKDATEDKMQAVQLRLKLMLTNNTKKPASSLLRNLTVTSDLIRMITKPSKKAKRLGNLMRNYCLRDGDKICLYSRINSQSVKTHYLSTTFSPVTKTMDVCVATQWSPWEIHHVDPSMGRGKALAYGSEVILTNVETGVRSETMILRKVDRGQIMIQTENIPVNQMHKLALQRKNDGYLSARTALSQKGLFENPFSSEHSEEASEVVGDFFLWTIVGVSQFKQSLYLLNLMGQPISKVPTVSDASYNANAGTLRLRISNFFYWDGSWKSYQLWLGERGPWPFTVESVHDQEVELQLLQVYPCAAVLPNDKSWKVCMCLVREDGLLVAATRDGFWLYCNALY